MKVNPELEKCLINNDIEFHCLMDIDDFGLYNSKYSFEKGNFILTSISEIVKEILNPDYWIYLGSDEYYFSISKDWSKKESAIFKLMQKIKSDLNITVSIGILTNDKNKLTSETFSILKNNVFNAKSNGKNRIYSL
jgi:diguanylate cyclase (GGDEF)-like protein